MAKRASEPQKLKIFVSYSRTDLEFADKLVAALEQRGFAVRIDKRDLPYGEKWQKELQGFVREADAIVFLVSPSSIASQWCKWEVAQVAAQSKRLVPVVVCDVAIDLLPPEISEVHLFPFGPELDFESRADTLASVLLTDRAWVQEHTRLGDLASSWLVNDRSRDRLLRGRALDDAEKWLTRRPAAAPPASQQHLDYIAASQASAKRTARRWVGGLSALFIGALALAGFAWQQKQVAERSEALAVEQRGIAERESAAAVAAQSAERIAREAETEQRRVAQANEALAKQQQRIAEDRAFDARLRAQAAEARGQLATDPIAALNRSAATMMENLESGRDVLPEVRASLFDTLDTARPLRISSMTKHGNFFGATSLAVSPDESLIVLGTTDMVHLLDRAWRHAAPPIAARDGRHGYANHIAWDEKGEVFAIASGGLVGKKVVNGDLRIFDRRGRFVQGLADGHRVPVLSVTFVPGTNAVLAGDAEGNILSFDRTTGTVTIVPTGHKESVHGMAWTRKGLSLAIGPARDFQGKTDTATPASQSPTIETDIPASIQGAGVEPSSLAPSGAQAVLTSSLGIAINLKVSSVSDTAARGLLCIASFNGFVSTCGADGNVNVWSTWDDSKHHTLWKSFRGHVGSVQAIAIHPGGKVFATGGQDGQIRLWSDDGVLLAPPLTASPGEGLQSIRALAFINGGRELLSAGSIGRLMLWDMRDIDGQDKQLGGYSRMVLPVDGGQGFVVTNSDDDDHSMIERIDQVGTSNVASRLLYGPDLDKLTFLVASSSGRKLIWAHGNRVVVADAARPLEYLQHETGSGSVADAAFGYGDRRLAVSGTTVAAEGATPGRSSDEKAKVSTLTLLDALTGRVVAMIERPHEGEIVALAGNPSLIGPAFVSAGSDGTVRFWSTEGQPLGRAVKLGAGADPSSFEAKLAFTADGQRAVIGWYSGGIKESLSNYQVWDAVSLSPVTAAIQVKGRISAVATHPSEDMVALSVSVAGDSFFGMLSSGTILLRSLLGAPIWTRPYAHATDINGLIFDAGGQRLISTDSQGHVRTWLIGSQVLLEVARARFEPIESQDRVDELISTANAAWEKNQTQETIQLLEQAREIDPREATVRVRLGNAYFADPEHQAKARPEYDKAIELEPYSNAILYFQRGKYKHRHGDYAGAVEDFTLAEQLWYIHLRGTVVIADFVAMNHITSEYHWINQAGAASEFHLRRGFSNYLRGRWKDAEADFTLCIEGSGALKAARARGIEVAEQLNADEYVAAFKQQLSLPGGNATPESYEFRARARIEQGKFAGAIADIRQAIALLKDRAKPYTNFSDLSRGRIPDPGHRAMKTADFHDLLASIHDAMDDSQAAAEERSLAAASFEQATKDNVLWGRFGVSMIKLTAERAGDLGLTGKSGVLVTDVHYGTPAQAAGLRVNDVILQFGGRQTPDTASLNAAIKEAAPLADVEVAIVRNKVMMSLRAMLDK